MSSLASRQIALLTVFATCALLVTLGVASGLGAEARTAVVQAWPLVGVCAIALVFILTDPFSAR
ncbi:MAG: hypothetical protein DCC58_14510 [Chloroflexi bacterium]|nr:MAG: hypothetical protein DCC58_14510 [Chloroflexota bacterium]